MLFRRKGRVSKEFDEKIIIQLELLKQAWMMQKNIIDKSIDPSDGVLYDLKVAESKYFFLLREAKHRKLFLGKP